MAVREHDLRGRVGPKYTWGKDGQTGGYGLNGRTPVSDILKELVFPSLAGLPDGSVVLDLGAGKGRIEKAAGPASQRSYSFLGIERDPAAVDHFNKAIELPDRAVVGDIASLELGGEKFGAMLTWRVAHCLTPDLQQAVFGTVAEHLDTGGQFHVAALSERDWKRQDLGRLYVPGEMNDCAPVMQVPGIENWELYFFRSGELVALGESVGLRLVQQRNFKELTGFKELEERGKAEIDYDYIQFMKG